MELRHLRYFVALAEELNFTRAAKRLCLAQPSLTRQIRNLEEELGVRLLERTRSGVLLTEHGHFLLSDARRLVALSLETVRSIQQFKGNGAAHLNIGYLPRFDSDLLPSTLAEFQRQRPEVALRLFDMPPADQYRALERRIIDVGFLGLRTDEPQVLNWKCVARCDMVAALPARHPLGKRKEINFSDLKGLSFVALSKQTHPGWREWICEICRQADFIPRIVQEVSSEAAVINFVAEGLGVALTSERIRSLPHSGVVFRPVVSAPKANYCIAWHRDNQSRLLNHYLALVEKRAMALYNLQV